ncbi:MAG: TetR family transcriptional regulator [Deltaproteobacteria bacterium]|nr:TetR family transcriptional regulator [Deltaproteobacteria bacterium]
MAAPAERARKGRGGVSGRDGRGVAASARARGPYARGVERRRALLEAVLRIVTREGVAGVTHRAVAAESGASLRATTYYFATKDDMILEAFRFFCEQSLEQIDAASQSYLNRRVEPGDAVAMIFEVVLKEWDNPNTSWVAEFELILAIAREPAFAPEYRAFQERLDEGLQLTMKRVGSKEPARDARIILAFLRGFELEQLSRPERKAWQRKLRSDLSHLVESLLG